MAKRERTRKVAVALPDMESAPDLWLRNIRLSGFAFIVLGLIVLSLVVLAPSLRTMVAQKQEITALEAAVDEKQNEVEDLRSDVARWEDPAYIEAQARERIFYVYPGEYPYIVIGDTLDGAEPTTEDGTPISNEIQETRTDWMQSLLGSVFTAGLTDATADDLDEKQK